MMTKVAATPGLMGEPAFLMGLSFLLLGIGFKIACSGSGSGSDLTSNPVCWIGTCNFGFNEPEALATGIVGGFARSHDQTAFNERTPIAKQKLRAKQIQ